VRKSDNLNIRQKLVTKYNIKEKLKTQRVESMAMGGWGEY